MSGAIVRDQFGEPEEISGPTGEPPITRWKYGEFTVYFESDFVIHSVEHLKALPAPPPPPPAPMVVTQPKVVPLADPVEIEEPKKRNWFVRFMLFLWPFD